MANVDLVGLATGQVPNSGIHIEIKPGADMIVTSCPVYQMNREVYQGQINKRYRSKFNIPVTYDNQLMAVA